MLTHASNDCIMEVFQGIAASLDYIKNLQAYPDMENSIKYAIANLVLNPEYNELLLSWCKESLNNRNESKNVNQYPDSNDIPNRVEILQEIIASLACIINSQCYLGEVSNINFATCNLADKPEFYELLLSWCKESLNNQNKSKNINQNPDGSDISNRIVVMEGIAASFDCIKNLKGYPGTSKVIKYAIADLVFKPEFIELLISWWNKSLNNRIKAVNINQHSDRVALNRMNILEKIVASLTWIKKSQRYSCAEKHITIATNNLVVKPEFYELISTWCKDSLNNQNKSKNFNLNFDGRDIPNKMEVLEGIAASFDCIKNLQGYPGTEKSIRYAIANLVVLSDFNELFSSWCKDSLSNQKKSKDIIQNTDGRVIPNRMVVLEGIAASLDCIKNLQVYPGTKKMIKFAIVNLVIKPEFNDLLSSWCKESLNNQNKSKNMNLNPDDRDIPNRMEEITDHLDCIKNLQGYPGTENVIKYAIANLVADPEFNELFSSWCRVKRKQNVLITDKSAKIPASSGINKDKPQLLKTRLSSTTEPGPFACISEFSSFLHHIKAFSDQNKAVQTPFSEAKASSSNLNGTPITSGAICKQNIHITDKTGKIPPSQTVTKNKPRQLKTRSSSTTEAGFSVHISKDKKKAVQTTIFEAKASRSNSNSTPKLAMTHLLGPHYLD